MSATSRPRVLLERRPRNHRADASRPIRLARHLDRNRIPLRDPEENGISHFIEHMVFKGTKNRSRRRHRPLGGFHRRRPGRLHRQGDGQLQHQGSGRALPLAFDVLADMVRNPLFREEDIEKEKGVILEELKMEVDNPEYLLHEIFSSNFWKDHPLGKPILGTKETVQKFDREMMHEYYQRYYSPSNILITAAGNLNHDHLVELAREHFEDLPVNGSAGARSRAQCRTRAWFFATRRRSSRRTCTWACRLTRSRTRLRFACYVLNTVLGGGMSSRLFQNIREKQGLAYAVYSELSMYRDTGCMAIYAGTSVETAPQSGRFHHERVPRTEGEPGSGGRAAPRQGSPEGLLHAGLGIHLQPHGQPGASGDVLQALLHSG